MNKEIKFVHPEHEKDSGPGLLIKFGHPEKSFQGMVPFYSNAKMGAISTRWYKIQCVTIEF